jgi:hypothetical protein
MSFNLVVVVTLSCSAMFLTRAFFVFSVMKKVDSDPNTQLLVVAADVLERGCCRRSQIYSMMELNSTSASLVPSITNKRHVSA